MSQLEYQALKQPLNKLLDSLQLSMFNEKFGSIKNILQNLEYRFNDPELHQYIPQLCFLYFVTNRDELRNLLMAYAYINIQNFFLLDWTIKAYNENPNGITIHQNYLAFRSKLSEQFVNKGLKQSQSFNDIQTLDDAFYVKDARATYLDRQDQLVFNLIEQSLHLKKVEIGLRKAHMSQFLRKINQNIEYLQKYLLPQFGGITLPFDHGKRESSLIINIIEDEFICFNTAKRVPYKIIVETVDPCEVYLIDKAVKIIEKAPELQAYYDIEKEMKAISQLKIFHTYNLEELKKLAHAKIEQITNAERRKRPVIIDKDIYQSRSNSSSPWGEDWAQASAKIQSQSQFGKLKSYMARQIIVKGGDDLRSELLVMQMMRKVASIFQLWGLQIYLRPYDIILTSPNSGILEFIPNTLSMDRIKKDYPDYSLKQFYLCFFDNFEEAQKNFAQSLAGYSIICYLFQLKDRHNGNILIDNQGHIIHIDFGFILTLTPGNMNFESAPFKLISEYEELLGGKDSDLFVYYKTLIASGFLALKEHVDEIITFIRVMLSSPKHNLLQCLQNFKLEHFRNRFHEKLAVNQIYLLVDQLVDDASDALSTRIYDYYQYKTNTIYY